MCNTLGELYAGDQIMTKYKSENRSLQRYHLNPPNHHRGYNRLRSAQQKSNPLAHHRNFLTYFVRTIYFQCFIWLGNF